MKLIRPADPDAALKAELRERWITGNPAYKQAAAARAEADAAAAALPWQQDALAYVNAVKTARATQKQAAEALAAKRSELELAYDSAVRLPDIDLEQVPGYKPFPPPAPGPVPVDSEQGPVNPVNP